MKKMLLGIVVVTVGFLMAASYGGADEHAEPANPFKGKLLIIGTKGHSNTYGAVIREPSVRKLGDSQFIIGTGVGGEGIGDWQKDRTVWVAIDDISQIVEYDSLEQYLAKVAEK
jgi:hypothetical protein